MDEQEHRFRLPPGVPPPGPHGAVRRHRVRRRADRPGGGTPSDRPPSAIKAPRHSGLGRAARQGGPGAPPGWAWGCCTLCAVQGAPRRAPRRRGGCSPSCSCASSARWFRCSSPRSGTRWRSGCARLENRTVSPGIVLSRREGDPTELVGAPVLHAPVVSFWPRDRVARYARRMAEHAIVVTTTDSGGQGARAGVERDQREARGLRADRPITSVYRWRARSRRTRSGVSRSRRLRTGWPI